MPKKFFQTKKVAVALSGGVDSSVAAALLKKQGFEVVGFHLMFWKAKENKGKNKEVKDRVKKIGEVLGVPIKFFDVKENFKTLVKNYFLKEMQSGRTPNTCVVCNREIKFKFLLEKAKELKCDYLATGHYARNLNSQSQNLAISKFRNFNIFRILQAKDKNKDQTYFLWGLKLTHQQWNKILFPIGEIASKQKVRQIAKDFNLPTYQTPSSSDACFLGSLDFNFFLREKLGEKKGKIIDKQGNILGEHLGLWFYTIGQRKGMGLSGGPYFVVAKDFKKNVLIVSKNEKDLLKKEIKFEDTNWLSQPKSFPLRAQAKIRYGAPLANCLVYKNKALFTKPQKAPTPGQSIVFYSSRHSSAGAKAGESAQLLGGGVIT